MNQQTRITKKNIELLDTVGNHICDIYEYTIWIKKRFVTFIYNPQENTYADTEDAYTEVGTYHPREEIFIYVEENKPENFKPSLREYMKSTGFYTEEEISEYEDVWNKKHRIVIMTETNDNIRFSNRLMEITGGSEIKVRNIIDN